MENWSFYSTARRTLRLRRAIVDELTTAQAVATFDGSTVIFIEPNGHHQLFLAKARVTRRSQISSWVNRFNELVRAESSDRAD
jgi:hypothetical protein